MTWRFEASSHNSISDNVFRPKGLRLLSLDGGGIRGLSELVVLQEFMQRVQYDLGLEATPKPCDYFDIVGGTSTGGLIALMLGRLRMSVEDVIAEYGRIGQEVFSVTKASTKDGKFKASKLQAVIKSIVAKATGDPETMLLDTMSNDNSCKTFVCAVPAAHIDKVQLFRSYNVRKNRTPDCHIWEAARATSAAPTFFKRIAIDQGGGIKAEYLDGGLGFNNPIEQVLQEAEAIYPGRGIDCIVSIGTGFPKVTKIPRPSLFQRQVPLDVIEAMKNIATGCEQKAEEYEQRFANHQDCYFRFSVEQGMQQISLQEWKKMSEVMTHTSQYTKSVLVSRKIDSLVRILES